MKPAIIASVALLLALPAGYSQRAGDQKPDEVDVNVLPKKGMKFDPNAIYKDDQAVLQGIFGTGGGDEVNDLKLLPSKEIIAVGRLGSPAQMPIAIPRGEIEGLPTTGNAFIARFNPAFRSLDRLFFLPADMGDLNAAEVGGDGALYLCGVEASGKGCFVIKVDAELRKLLWRIDLPGSQADSMAVMSDNSVVVHVGGAFIARVKPDGSGTMPWGLQPYFRLDRANPGIQQKYWSELGYQGRGFRDRGFLAGGLSSLGLTPDGDLVIMACNEIADPNGSPDFDPMLVKFTTTGEIVWAKNLVDGIPSEPDQKNPRLYVDPYSGDLIVSLNQHGSFGRGHDLVLTPGCYLTADDWFTGDVFLGWIARVDSKTGGVKASTMYFPDLRKAPENGKSFANSLFPEAVRTDAEGHIYVTGATAYKLATTTNAFQPEPLGGNSFLTVFDAGLSHVIYASLITAQGVSLRAKHLVITDLGPVVASSVAPPEEGPASPAQGIITANNGKTNFLKAGAVGGSETILSLFPSRDWFEDWSK